MPQAVHRKMARSWTRELQALGKRLPVFFARSEVRERRATICAVCAEPPGASALGSWPKCRQTLHPM